MLRGSCLLARLRKGEYFFFSFFKILFLERGKEREKEGETCQCVVASCTPCTRDPACNPVTCPDWESNRRHFGSQAGTQSTEPHLPGPGPALDGKHCWLQRRLPSKPTESTYPQSPGTILVCSEFFQARRSSNTPSGVQRASKLLIYSRTHKATCGHLVQEVKGRPSTLKRNRSGVFREVRLCASHCASHLWEAPPHRCLCSHCWQTELCLCL